MAGGVARVRTYVQAAQQKKEFTCIKNVKYVQKVEF